MTCSYLTREQVWGAVAEGAVGWGGGWRESVARQHARGGLDICVWQAVCTLRRSRCGRHRGAMVEEGWDYERYDMSCEPLINGSWRTCRQHKGGTVCEACFTSL